MEEKQVILLVEHLMISFSQYVGGWRQRKLPVIRDLNIKVREHEVVAVAGSSGSGKSLLAHAVMGLLPQNAACQGTVFFEGEILNQKRKEQLRGSRMVLVPQSVSYLDPLMKVGEQVRRGQKDKESVKRCRESLGRYGLGEDTEGLYPFELSGGMTRRVLISTAVMEHPRLVIADEPTPGLHIRAARRVLNHFREIADEGAGVLLITHDWSWLWRWLTESWYFMRVPMWRKPWQRILRMNRGFVIPIPELFSGPCPDTGLRQRPEPSPMRRICPRDVPMGPAARIWTRAVFRKFPIAVFAAAW